MKLGSLKPSNLFKLPQSLHADDKYMVVAASPYVVRAADRVSVVNLRTGKLWTFGETLNVEKISN
jgi:hypothetical protein